MLVVRQQSVGLVTTVGDKVIGCGSEQQRLSSEKAYVVKGR